MSWDVATYTGSAVAALTIGYLYDKRKKRRRREQTQNYTVARNQTFRLVQDLRDKTDGLDENVLKKYEDYVYEIYVSILAEKEAHEEILSEQLNLALDTIAAVEALRGNEIKENTPPEIRNVIESRLALEQSRQRISIWGSRKDDDGSDMDDSLGKSLPCIPSPSDTPALAIENGDETLAPPMMRARSLITFGGDHTNPSSPRPQKLTRKKRKNNNESAPMQRSSTIFNWLASSVPLGRQD